LTLWLERQELVTFCHEHLQALQRFFLGAVFLGLP
jgi:hypothetical protein